MYRVFQVPLAAMLLIAAVGSGCNSSSKDAAANWDGTSPRHPLPPRTFKKSKQAPQASPKMVRGFTVPTTQ